MRDSAHSAADDLGRQLIHDKQVDLILLDFSKAFDKVNHLKAVVQTVPARCKRKRPKLD